MTSLELSTLLQKPELINADQTDLLDGILKEFPYFQSARAIHLKGLKNKDSFKYNQALKTNAAYTTDRSILFDFITSDSFNQNEVSEYIKHNSDYINDLDVFVEDISLSPNLNYEERLKKQIQEVNDILDPELFQPKVEEKEIVKQTTDTNKSTKNSEEDAIDSEAEKAKDILKVGTPLDFDKTETHSFNEWLNIAKFKPISRQENNKEEDIVVEKKEATNQDKNDKTIDENNQDTIERAKKFELIDQFITKNPKLEAKKANVTTHNIAKQQMIQPESLMTETLARIYVEQKNYKKAIQSYKILILKYPEKSGFFADQIKAIKKLQE